jgi:hypothetical protein
VVVVVVGDARSPSGQPLVFGVTKVQTVEVVSGTPGRRKIFWAKEKKSRND